MCWILLSFGLSWFFKVILSSGLNLKPALTLLLTGLAAVECFPPLSGAPLTFRGNSFAFLFCKCSTYTFFIIIIIMILWQAHLPHFVSGFTTFGFIKTSIQGSFLRLLTDAGWSDVRFMIWRPSCPAAHLLILMLFWLHSWNCFF